MPIGHVIAYKAMHRTWSVGLPELRALACVMAEGLDDESLSVIAGGVGECNSFPRKTFLMRAQRFNWTQLSKMLAGMLMLDQFVAPEEKQKLMKHYGLDKKQMQRESRKRRSK